MPTVNIHITSEENAYGRYGDDYFEGQEISFVGLVDKELWIKLQPEKYLFLDMSKNPKSQCKQNVSFYDSFDTLLMEEISKKCPMRCLPYISKNPHNSICKTEDEFDCAHDVFYKVKSNDSFLHQSRMGIPGALRMPNVLPTLVTFQAAPSWRRKWTKWMASTACSLVVGIK